MKARKRTKKTESLQSRRSAQGDRRRSTLTAGQRGARACAGGDCLWWHRLQSQADALASTCLRRHFPQTHPQRRTVTSISFLLLPQTSHQSVALTAQKWVSKGLGTDRNRTMGQRAARVTDSGFRGSAQRGLCFPASPPQLFRPHLSVPCLLGDVGRLRGGRLRSAQQCPSGGRALSQEPVTKSLSTAKGLCGCDLVNSVKGT